MSDGYAATMKLAAERPDLLPLLRKCHAAATVQDVFALTLDGDTEGLAELERRGLIERVGSLGGSTSPRERAV